jgi:hypothetical protein
LPLLPFFLHFLFFSGSLGARGEEGAARPRRVWSLLRPTNLVGPIKV